MIRIDRLFGAGSGQILPTSLSLSRATGKAFRIEKVRAGRERPGLLRQHLTPVLAAAEVGGAVFCDLFIFRAPLLLSYLVSQTAGEELRC
jgi:RNA 3'-terminal phosphate cyclase